MPGLPQGGGFWNMAQGHMNTALGAYGGQRPGQKTEMTPPGKTAGGALSSAAGMGMAGYSLGSSIGAGTAAGASAGGGYGALAGAAVGLMAYLMS